MIGLLLACTSSTEPASPAPDEGFDWSLINAYPCAHHRDGRVRCWYSEQWSGERQYRRIPDSPWPVDVFHVDEHVAWGIGPGGVAESWFCGLPDADPGICGVPQLDFTVGTQQCGLRPDGTPRCWTEYPVPTVETPIVDLLPLAESTTFVLEDGRAILSVGQAPSVEVQTAGALEVAPIVRGICVLTEHGEVVCDGDPDPRMAWPIAFDSPPYRRLVSGRFAVCAVREDWVVECHNGEEHDFGEIVDLVVSTYVGPEGEESSSSAYHLCVMLPSGEIQCEGPRYHADLVERLGETSL